MPACPQEAVALLLKEEELRAANVLLSKTGGYTPSEHLRGKHNFALFSKAKHFGAGFLVAAVIEGDCRKISFVAGKKVSAHAVKRNKVKRQLREIYRHNRNLLPDNVWIMLIAKPGAVDATYKELENNFLKICKRINSKPANDTFN